MLPQRLKFFLKRNPFIYEVNARLKAWKTSRELRRLNQRYSDLGWRSGVLYSQAAAVEQLRLRLARRHIDITPVRKGGLRIFWVGANRDQDNSGFLAALKKFGEVTCFRNSQGGYGLWYLGRENAVRLYDPEVVRRNDECLIGQVEAELGQGRIHVLLGQMWANFVSFEALRQVQRMGLVTVNISMDDRLPEHWMTYRKIRLGPVGLCEGLDLMLTSSPECCVRYAVEGCPSLYWPMASDPERFKPYPEAEKIHDVSFVGNKYGLRGEIVWRVQRAGIRVEAFGYGWPNGPVDADQSAEIFGKSRIILGVGTVGYNKNIFTLKLRDFDATMAGALYITHRNPDLEVLFQEGKEIECYGSIDECVEKVRYYLDHPDRRIAIAAAAATRARRDHTWEQRISAALRAIGLLSAQPEAQSRAASIGN